MKRWILYLALSTSTFAHATLGYWASTNDKIAREKQFQHANVLSTSTFSHIWNGTTVTPVSARGQTVGFELIAYSSANATVSDLNLSVSSFSCTDGSSIVNTVVASSLNVMDYTGRPIQVFAAGYVQSVGMSNFPYGRDEYEERQYPLDYRVPCTITAGHCIPNGGTDTWGNRPYNNLNVPIVWIPDEEFAVSSHTLLNNNSLSFDVDVWVSTNTGLTGNAQCNGLATFKTGVSVSAQIPISIQVYNARMPASPGMMAFAYVANSDTTGRITGNRSPSQPLTGNALTAVNNVAKMFKAHSMFTIGDNPDTTSLRFPSQQAKTQLSGSLYTTANGYANARSAGVGDPLYMIGSYGVWASWPGFSTTNASLFCVASDSWSVNLAQYSNLKVGLYGQDEAANLQQNETWATWLSTVCAQSGARVNLFVTGDINVVQSTAPHSSYVASTNIYGNGVSSSSSNWQTNFDRWNTGTSSIVFRYNGGTQGQGAVYPYEEEGYVPKANLVGYWKKTCPGGVCRGGWFGYEGNYWRNTNAPGGCGNGSGDLDLYNTSCTFGYFSSSGTALQFGTNGFQWSQGDGILAYYGKDTVYGTSFGPLGAFPAFTLKAIRSGVDMVDHINLAYAVNASSTMAIVNQIYPQALWEVTCAAPATDCSYSYGDRSWSYIADTWDRADDRFLQIASGAPSLPPTIAGVNVTGKVRLFGTVSIK